MGILIAKKIPKDVIDIANILNIGCYEYNFLYLHYVGFNENKDSSFILVKNKEKVDHSVIPYYLSITKINQLNIKSSFDSILKKSIKIHFPIKSFGQLETKYNSELDNMCRLLKISKLAS